MIVIPCVYLLRSARPAGRTQYNPWPRERGEDRPISDQAESQQQRARQEQNKVVLGIAEPAARVRKSQHPQPAAASCKVHYVC